MNLSAIVPLPYRILAYVLVGLALIAFGWVKGDEHGTEKLIDYVAKQAAETVRVSAARVEVVTVAQTKYLDRLKTIYVQGEEIERTVIQYVTQADDARCVIPVGFVREYNAAWSGSPPGSPAEPDRGPSGISLSAVAQADAHNATSCLAYKTQRDGLIEFYRKMQAVK